MKLSSSYLIIVALAVLASCDKSLSWTRLDGSSTNAERLQQASKDCRIDIKLAGLERAKQDRKNKLKKASSSQAEKMVNDEYEQIKSQVYREIDTCMTKKGYKR